MDSNRLRCECGKIFRTARGRSVHWFRGCPAAIKERDRTIYQVTCPSCNAKVETYWDDYPPGGVTPVECKCGYIILSESEGDPKEITRRER